MAFKKIVALKPKKVVLAKVTREKKIIELKDRLKRFRKARFTKEELSVINNKIISTHKEVIFHFTDIHFLKDIMLEGLLHSSQGTFSSLNNIKQIKGDQYSSALESYRFYKTRKYEKKSIHAETIKDFILNNQFVGFNRPKFKVNLKNRNLINNFELKELLGYYKKFILNKKDLGVFKKNDLIRIQELQSRMASRYFYFSLNVLNSFKIPSYTFENMTNNLHTRFNSSMNIGLIIDKRYDNTAYPRSGGLASIINKAKIEGIVTYRDNLKEVFKVMLENSRTIEDIVPIYDYNGKVLFPKVK